MERDCKVTVFVNGSVAVLKELTQQDTATSSRPSVFRGAVEWTVGCLFTPNNDSVAEDAAPGSCAQPLHADVDGLQILARPWSTKELRAVANRRKKMNGVAVTDVFYAGEAGSTQRSDEL